MPSDAGPLTLLEVLKAEYVAVRGDNSPEAVAVEKAEDLASFYAAVHTAKVPQGALCLSGGGIRSATFCLGVIQSLAKRELLGSFDYLSTVSGGGYIGSWLSAWIHREGRQNVFDALKGSTQTTNEPPQIVHLREYSNYLSPKVGLGSADSWTLLAIYVRNLLLNWLVLLPALMLPLLLPRLYLALLDFSCGNLKWVLLAAGGVLESLAIARLEWSQPSLGEFHSARERKRNDQGRFLRRTWGPLLLSAVALTAAWYGIAAAPESRPAWRAFIAFQCAVSFVGWLVNLVASLLVNCKAKKDAGKEKKWHSLRQLAVRLMRELVFVLFSAAVGGLLMWIFATWDFIDPQTQVLRFACWAPALYLGTFLLSGALLHGIVNAITNSDSDLEWTARSAAWLLIATVGWLTGSAVVIFGPMLVIWMIQHFPRTISALGGASGLSGIIVALLGMSQKTPASNEEAAAAINTESVLAKFQTIACKWAQRLAVVAFILFVMIGLTFASDWLMRSYSPPWPSAIAGGCGLTCPHQNADSWFAKSLVDLRFWPTLFFWALVFAGLSFGFGLAVNINKFSLQGLYRNRLIRAYLGASRLKRTESATYVPFTGFDSEDNIRLCKLDRRKNWGEQPEQDTLQMRSEQQPTVDLRPLHVINIALNLVAGKNLGWQERKAESFTATALHCGSGTPGIGYRKTEQYAGGKDGVYGGWRKSMSLGGAMAISGAAASPNMGYNSSPTIAFLMALFNVRLGAWFGNPGPAGSKCRPPSYGRSAPLQANRPFIDEALGLTDDTHPYVYLSDGGHFENLGLYEMVRRRCRFIVVCDADEDGSCAFDNLGNAIRKIYIDMGVRIDFKMPLPIYPRRPKPTIKDVRYWAVGSIQYEDVDGGGAKNGTLLYVKPALYGEEPADICSYANQYQNFPHDPTVNQFFTESQFESYRGLGFHAMESFFPQGGGAVDLAQLIVAAEKLLQA